MKLFLISLISTLLCLSMFSLQVRAQNTMKPSANRFSDGSNSSGAGTSSVPAKAPLSASKKAAAVREAQWYTLALAVFLSLRYLAWIAGFLLAFCILSYGLAQLMYRNHQPQSAHGAAHWSLFWALLICGLVPFPLAFFISWSWTAWILLSFPFLLLTLILIVTRPAHSR